MRSLLVIVIIAIIAMTSVVLVLAAGKGTSEDTWNNNPTTTNMWKVISDGDLTELKQMLETNPEYANVRSGDGRGPLWWAYEYGKQDIVDALIEAGAKPDERDADGKSPKEITSVGPTSYEQEGNPVGGGGGGGAPSGGGAGGAPDAGMEDDDDDV